MSLSYADFLQRKARVYTGRGIQAPELPTQLYEWQAAIVRWALRKGRASIFADCGLGKTFMQVAWADALNVPALILAPLCVAEQTVAEAAKLGIEVVYAPDHRAAHGHRIAITNYERLEKFDTSVFSAVVLDESSILKAFDGKTRTRLIESFKDTPYRLCCTATPSPNDIAELANHAEFMGLMTRPEFLATWFINIQSSAAGKTKGWRMKRYAVDAFYRWLASWAVSVRSPSDLGYDDAGFVLPKLNIQEEVLSLTAPVGDALFPEMGMKGLSGRLAARRTALVDRVEACARLVQNGEQWILWCGLNAESDALAKAIPDAVNVEGSDSYSEKVGAVQAFVRGDIRVLISKVDILGFGMNFQHCHNMAFVGLSDSYESYYQAIRRCWRYGQSRPVNVHIVVSEAEQMVVENVRRKEARASELGEQLLRHLQVFEREEVVGAA
jgi:superfamily II DNA or RNA helicase